MNLTEVLQPYIPGLKCSVSLCLSVPEASSEVIAARHKGWSGRGVDNASYHSIVTCNILVMSFLKFDVKYMIKYNLQIPHICLAPNYFSHLIVSLHRVFFP